MDKLPDRNSMRVEDLFGLIGLVMSVHPAEEGMASGAAWSVEEESSRMAWSYLSRSGSREVD